MERFFPKSYPEDRPVPSKKMSVKTLTASVFVIDAMPFGTVYDEKTVKMDPLDLGDNRKILLERARIVLDTTRKGLKLEEDPRELKVEDMLKDHELLKNINDAGFDSKIIKILTEIKRYLLKWFNGS
ncbi:MAG: hypothetical protein ACOZAR_01455 [Patescibacteria group bacterium]